MNAVKYALKYKKPTKEHIRKFVAKPAAYVTLVTTSALGCLTLLKPLSSGVALLITALIVLGACFTLLEE